MEEQQQIRALRRRETDVLDALIDQYTPYVGAIIVRIIGPYMSQEDVEEVVSDVFYALWCSADHLQEGKLKAYLGAIARNRAKNKLRQLGKTLPLDEELLLIAPDSPEQTAQEREQAAALREALLTLEEEERTVFILFYFYDDSVAVISSELGLKESTVKSKLKRGRVKLKTKLLEGGFCYAI